MVKANLEFKLLSPRKIAGIHLLRLTIKNRNSHILKNLVVRLHSADPGFSADCAECFVYALMPNESETVQFRVSLPSRARTYFTVDGYSRGDCYFSTKSPLIIVQTRKTKKTNELLA